MYLCWEMECESHSVVSDSLRPHSLYSSWNSPGQSTGVGSLSLLQGIFPTQELNQVLLHCRWILYQLSYHISCHVSKQGCHSHQWFSLAWSSKLWGHPGRRGILTTQEPSGCRHSQQWAQRNSGCEKTQDAGPRQLRCIRKQRFSELRLLHLPILSKALNSLAWNLRFSLIHKMLLMFRLPALCCKFLYNVTSPHHSQHSWSSSLSVIEMLSPRLEVLKIPTE